MKKLSFFISPVTTLASGKISHVYREIKQSLENKLAASVILLVSVLLLYTFVLFGNVLTVVILMRYIKMFFCILIVFIIDLILLLISFCIGKSLLTKTVRDDKNKLS